MKRSKFHPGSALVRFLLTLLLAEVCLSLGAYGALTVSPAAVDNTYTGNITLNITGLSNSQTVKVEEFMDIDGSGAISAGDLLMRQFQVKDGQVTSINGHRNVNIPGDEDGLTNSQIQTKIVCHPGDGVDTANGKYLFRVSKVDGATFAPFTGSFTVNQKDYGGSGISGIVKFGGVSQPGAVVLIFNALSSDQEVSGITSSGANGVYSLKLPPGKYRASAWKSGYVGNLELAPTISVGAGAFAINQNITLIQRTRTISGKVQDKANAALGLPGVLIFATAQYGYISLGFSDGAGNYTADATSGPWSLELNELGLSQMGYLQTEFQEGSTVDVTGFNLEVTKATSLIFGSIKTPGPGYAPMPFVRVEGESNGSPGYKSVGISDAAGNYSLGVVPGSWRDRGDSSTRSFLIKEQTVAVNTDDIAVQLDHTAHLTNAHLRGQVRDNHNNIVSNVALIARDPTFNGEGEINAFGFADANGNFDIQVYGGGAGGAAQLWQLQLLQSDHEESEYVSTGPQFAVQDGVDINGITYLVYAVTAHLRGQILDESNAPVGNVNIYAGGDNGNLLSGSNADGDGHFDLPVFGGNWNLGLSNIQGLGLLPQDVVIGVTDGVNQDNLVFRALHSTGAVEGTVKDSGDAPVGQVTLYARATIGGTDFTLTTLTESDGSYSFSLPSGTWSLSMDRDDLTARGFLKPADQNAFISAGTVTLNFLVQALNPGELNGNFDPNVSGVSGSVLAIAKQADGKTLIGGKFNMVGTTARNNIARLEVDGTLDASFDPGTGPDDTVKCIAVQPDGKILIGGDFSNVGAQVCHHLARLDSAGAVEGTGSFNPGNIGTDGVNCIALRDDGRILIGGGFSEIDGAPFNRIAQLEANGAVVGTGSFNPGAGANNEIFSIAVQEDGKILIGGNFSTVNNLTRNGIARLNANGTVEDTATFNPGAGANGIVYCLALQADGKILLGGAFTQVNDLPRGGIARLGANGLLEDANTFDPGTGANGSVYSIAVQADGKILLGGDFTEIGGNARNRIAKLTSSGVLENTTNFALGSGADGPVYGVALQADGGILVGGSFTQVNTVARGFIAMLGNTVASRSLQAPNDERISWMRGGSAAEVVAVTFDISADGGVHWTPLGTGTRVAGGWELDDQFLPLSGVIRARGRTSGGSGNGSSGLMEQATVFTFGIPTPEIAVFEGAGTSGNARQDDEGTFDFGSVGLNSTSVRTFTILNAGTGKLNNLSVTKGGTDAALFVVNTMGMSTTLAPRESATFAVQFSPSNTGPKSAVIHLLSNDGDEASFEINLAGTGSAATPPVVATLSADGFLYNGANLRGSINAAGSPRMVMFDYGLTTSYGMSALADQSPVSSSNTANVNTVVTGLLPHTKYNFRVRATGALGSASGANQTFTTLDRAPAVSDEHYSVLPGTKAVFNVLANDSDPDGDALTLVSLTALSTPAAGTLTKSGNAVTFTPSAAFTGGTVSFGYTVGDGFGMTSSGVTTIGLAAFTLAPAKTIPDLSSAAGTYTITVNNGSPGNDGLWAVTSAPAWVSVSPKSGMGTGPVTVSYQANASLNGRSGSIVIGGQTHDISQAGVATPKLYEPDPGDLTAIVGNFYSLLISTDNGPVTYKITPGLPAGLKMDNATGIISGVPSKGSDTLYHLTISASNAAGSAPDSISFDLNVQPISTGVVGVFNGFIDRDDNINGGIGSRLELTITPLGSYTGKIITGTTTTALKGLITTYPNDPDHPTLTLNIPRKGASSLTLDLNFEAGDETLSGSLDDDGSAHTAGVKAWHNGWSAMHPATDYARLYNFTLKIPGSGSDDALPQGTGFGSFTVKDTTGVLNVAGKLPEGSAFTTGTFAGPGGQVLIYQPLYNNKGSIGGAITITAVHGSTVDNTLTVASGDALTWMKPPPIPNSKDTLYRDGFGPVELFVEGGAYVPPLPGDLVMGLDPPAIAGDNNASIYCIFGGLTSPVESLFNISAAPNSLTNKATMPSFASGDNPNKLALPTLTAATGVFSGSFLLPGDTAALDRKVSFQGLIIKPGVGYGFFLLPEVPSISGQTLTTTPKHSGFVLIGPARRR